MNESRILIVDDDDDDRYMIAEAFEKAGEKVKLDLMSNGTEAIGFLLSTPQAELPCLVVLDYNMPVMNGKEVVEILCNHEKLKDVPAIIFSTANSPSLREECIKSGALAFKTKPLHFDDLVKSAQEMLELCKVGIKGKEYL